MVTARAAHRTGAISLALLRTVVALQAQLSPSPPKVGQHELRKGTNGYHCRFGPRPATQTFTSHTLPNASSMAYKWLETLVSMACPFIQQPSNFCAERVLSWQPRRGCPRSHPPHSSATLVGGGNTVTHLPQGSLNCCSTFHRA